MNPKQSALYRKGSWKGLLYKVPTPWKEYQMDWENVVSELTSQIKEDKEKEFGDRFFKLSEEDLDELLKLLSFDGVNVDYDDDMLSISNDCMRIKIRPCK